MEDLLRRALALVDPPRRSPAPDEAGGPGRGGRRGSGDGGPADDDDARVEDAAPILPTFRGAADEAAPPGDAARPEGGEVTDDDDMASLFESEGRSLLRSGEALFDPRRKPEGAPGPTAADAADAYDLLIAAAGREVGPPGWEGLGAMADVYRALLAVSCLLLELLPRADDSEDQRQSAPEGGPTDRPPPTLTPDVEGTLLSTCRRSVLLLKCLERACAARAVAERRRGRSGAGSAGLSAAAPSEAARSDGGGDDVHDYDRLQSDIAADHDWHDDGFLPRPRSSAGIGDGDGDDAGDFTTGCLLAECLVRPADANRVERCRRHEKTARTRHWNRGERVVSLDVADYVRRDDGSDPREDVTYLEGQGISRGYDASDVRAGEEISLDFSRHALAGEEDALLDIMLPETAAPSRGDVRPPRRKKRRKGKSGKVGGEKAAAEAGMAEGFLLLVSSGSSGGLARHTAASDCADAESDPPASTRVYAVLRPSGWLSVEDRSVLHRPTLDGTSSSGEGRLPLERRRRRWDLLLDSRTEVAPCLAPGGPSSFRLRLDGALLLGTSTPSGVPVSSDGDFDGEEGRREGSRVNLLLEVDEGTGGTFCGGCAWVSALECHIARSKELRDSVRAEWRMEE